MQFSQFSFLQKSQSLKLKDLAFFQILKRKGPYVNRSLIKIQNDIFYKNKFGTQKKFKNLQFVKDIRKVMVTYQIIINQVRNDFMMTQLDQLGEGLHKMFSQMISIISYLSKVVLRRQKESSQNKYQPQIKQKQIKPQIKTFNSIKPQASIYSQRLKQLQAITYTLSQYYKQSQIQTNEQNLKTQSIYKQLIQQTASINGKCINIKQSKLNQLLKDSCDYLSKNHGQLKKIVRLTQFDILKAQKQLTSLTHSMQNVENQHHNYIKLQSLSKQLISMAKHKVYQGKSIMTQTIQITTNDNQDKLSNDKKKLQYKLTSYESSIKSYKRKIQELEQKIKSLQQISIIKNQHINQQLKQLKQSNSFKYTKANRRNHNLFKINTNKSQISTKQKYTAHKIDLSQNQSGINVNGNAKQIRNENTNQNTQSNQKSQFSQKEKTSSINYSNINSHQSISEHLNKQKIYHKHQPKNQSISRQKNQHKNQLRKEKFKKLNQNQQSYASRLLYDNKNQDFQKQNKSKSIQQITNKQIIFNFDNADKVVKVDSIKETQHNKINNEVTPTPSSTNRLLTLQTTITLTIKPTFVIKSVNHFLLKPSTAKPHSPKPHSQTSYTKDTIFEPFHQINYGKTSNYLKEGMFGVKKSKRIVSSYCKMDGKENLIKQRNMHKQHKQNHHNTRNNTNTNANNHNVNTYHNDLSTIKDKNSIEQQNVNNTIHYVDFQQHTTTHLS